MKLNYNNFYFENTSMHESWPRFKGEVTNFFQGPWIFDSMRELQVSGSGVSVGTLFYDKKGRDKGDLGPLYRTLFS